LAVVEKKEMNILALDLATNCGFAHNLESELSLGTWKLATPAEIRMWGQNRMTRRNDPRVGRLYNILSGLPSPIDAVVMEDVQFMTYTQQCQLWSSLRAAVWLAFDPSVCECVPVKTLKQFATGSGVATKEAMVAAAIRVGGGRFKGVSSKNKSGVWTREPENFWDESAKKTLDDNAADAYHIFRWAEQNLSRRKVA
jgi:hypothetical protein